MFNVLFISIMVKEITVTELQNWQESGKDFQLIDVREQFETEIASIGGELIPLGQILQHSEKLEKSKDVVIYCRSGRRSAEAILQLQNKDGFTNLYNLKGGIIAWSQEIDPSIPIY